MGAGGNNKIFVVLAVVVVGRSGAWVQLWFIYFERGTQLGWAGLDSISFDEAELEC